MSLSIVFVISYISHSKTGKALIKTFNIFYFAIAVILAACDQGQDRAQKPHPSISTDIAQLSALLRLDEHQPTQVRFTYQKAYPGNSSRVSVPGPTDYTMQAVMTFGQKSIKRLKNDSSLFLKEAQQTNNDSFKFEWLNDDIIQAIDNSESPQYDINFFRDGTFGSFVIVDDQTVILYYFTK